MKTLVFNGWAAGHEAWDLCTFEHDWVFSYLEELDGLPDRVLQETDAAILVGFSMGGNYALRMLLRYPEKVRGLVLISTTPRMMEEREAGWAGLSERRLKALDLGTRMLFSDNPSPIYADANLTAGLDYLKASDLRQELTEFTASRQGGFPVAVFHSERDGIVRPHNAAWFKERFPQAQVTMVPGNEHVLPVVVPELISQAVLAMQQEAAK